VIDTQQQCFAKGFLKQCSSKQMSKPCQMILFDLSQYLTSLSSAVLARIFPLLDIEPESMGLAEACFLRDSDFYDSKSLKLSSLKTSKASSVAATARTSEKSSQRLGNWGMWALGSSAMDAAGFPRAEREYLLWVISGNIQCRKVEPNRPTLQDCLDNCGNQSHSAATILDRHKDGDRFYHDHSPTLVTPSGGTKFAVIYRSAAGDRTYTEEAPTLRSLANTGGKHQGGSGAWKVVEYKDEEYIVSDGLPLECSTLAATEAYVKTGERPRRVKDGKPFLVPMGYRRQRPLSATEFERLMGWPVGCTAKGTTTDDKEITISKTQRQKMLRNGIIPHEIEDVCNKLKCFIHRD